MGRRTGMRRMQGAKAANIAEEHKADHQDSKRTLSRRTGRGKEGGARGNSRVLPSVLCSFVQLHLLSFPSRSTL